MTKQPLLVMAAGGTGGHMFPAQALAEAMLARGWRVKLSTDARGARYTGGFPAGVEIEQVASATFSRGGVLAKLAVPFRILGGVIGAWAKLRRDRPDVVIGFGGYPTIPAMCRRQSHSPVSQTQSSHVPKRRFVHGSYEASQAEPQRPWLGSSDSHQSR